MKRKPISKALRFTIFSRDRYTCRYCGGQPGDVVLTIDHVIPVAQGGTNDPENLATACQDCNGGKGARTPTRSAPTEADRLRLAQERQEQLAAANDAATAIQARIDERQHIVNLWCQVRARPSVDESTINVIIHYVGEFGVAEVLKWIQKAHARFPHGSDSQVGRYISGIRRLTMEQAV